MNVVRITIISLLLFLGVKGVAADFSQADHFYQLRAENFGNPINIIKSRLEYESLIDNESVTDDELVYAVVQIAKTFYFQGELLTSRDELGQQQRRDLFSRCWRHLMPLIHPTIVGERVEYYYWRSYCLALYGESSNESQNLQIIELMSSLFSAGQALDQRYFGGGLKRVEAFVRGNAKAQRLPGDIYQPELALQLIEESLASPAYPGQGFAGQGLQGQSSPYQRPYRSPRFHSREG